MSIESFASNYKETISLFSVLGTWAAVLVALYIANRQNKPRLKVFVEISHHIPPKAQGKEVIDVKSCERCIGVTMQNKGNIAVEVTYWGFCWRLPWPFRCNAMQLPYLPDFRGKPIRIEPGQGVSIFLTNDLKQHKDLLENLCKENKLPKCFQRLVFLNVLAADGSQFEAKLGSGYKKEFLKN